MKGNFRRTPKGECFMEYCRVIANGTFTDKDYIADYENAINNIISTIENNNHLKTDRKIVAMVIYTILKEGKSVYNE